MDYTKLRAAALRDGEAEEAVTVDTRALIDKVLARYSGEWTTLRELIQNAADAQATTVKIKWETTPSTTVPLPSGGSPNEMLRHTILHHTLRRLLVENDGQSFTPTDWARLKRIAEGNPDETKIGAFGVGFYSVFADCEEPFVSSGREAMAFYWKGNALFTRKLVLPEEGDPTQPRKEKTTFVLDYRNNTTALPNLLSVSQFLATSLTFVALQRIEFWIDDWKILDLHKKLSPSTIVDMPRNLDVSTKEGLMKVAAVERLSAQIDAIYMHVVSWRPPTTSGSGSGAGNANSSSSAVVSSSGSNSKSTDTYGISSGDLPSLRSFFSRLTGASSSSSAAQKEQRNKAVREEKAVEDVLLQNLTREGRATIFLRVTTASVQTRVAANFASELERATKKPPPKTTKMAILTSSYDDIQASDEAAKPAIGTASNTVADALVPTSQSAAIIPPADVFASVLPSKKPGGRIFIGFPTQQTTGGGMHISAPSLIPTVEREAIDLNARWVRNWNMELLRVAGILARLAFINEMSDLDSKFRRHVEDNRASAAGAKAIKNSRVAPIPTSAEVAKFVPEALHILKTYTFGDSTPSAYVGQIIEEAFWTTCKQPSLDIFSSRGVMSTSKVRMESAEVSKFVNGIPVIVSEMKSSPFIQKLHEFGILLDVTIEDVRSELESKPLNRDQLIHFIKWIASGASSGELDPPSVRSMLRVAVASVAEGEADGGEEGGRIAIIELRAIQNYLTGNKIPPNLPLPPYAIPFSITSTISPSHLQALGWTQLELVPWLEFLLSARAALGTERNMTENAAFAAQVLMVLSKNWDNMSTTARTSVIAALTKHTCMPTRMGMKKPEEAFFPSVKLFDDLPILAANCHNLKERFLVALGVRKTIDLDTIFTRLLNQSASPADSAASNEKSDDSKSVKSWSHVELIKYLASVRNDIPPSDLDKLRKYAFCPAEAGPPGKESTVSSVELYRPDQLFEASKAVRELGFKILQWPESATSYFRKSSAEAAFLSELGLRMYPSVHELLEKMASPDVAMRDKARAYFINNHQINGYGMFRMATTTMAILPVMGGGEGGKAETGKETLVTPSNCYTNVNAAVLGFAILRSDLHPHASKFGVSHDPPIEECVARLLAKPPQSHDEAVTVFTYFSSMIARISGESLAKLKRGAFVPITRKSSSSSQPSAPALNANGYPVDKKSAKPSPANTVRHVQPHACYLGSSSTYGDIFDFVNFGVNANAFLFKCGSKSEPTKIEIARLACTEPARLLSTLQTTERYLSLLRSLAEDLPNIKTDRDLFRQMKTAPFLLASREIVRQPQQQPTSQTGGFSSLFSSMQQPASGTEDGTPAADADDEPPIRQYQLVEASKIAILDDYISYRLFKDKLMCAPEEDVLETFYMELGAQMLSNIVQEDIRIGPAVASASNDEQAASLRTFVLERSKIFLFEYQKYRRDAIKHDHKWLEKHLTVQMVQSVALRRSLRGSGETHTEKRSAASSRSSSSGYVLYVSTKSRMDMYQIGQAVCQLVLNRPSQQAYFFFEPFLKLDLLDLRARGYNVDRILRAKAAEARVAEEERRKALEDEQERIRTSEREWNLQGQQQRAIAAAARNETKTPEPRMPGAFGDDGSPDDRHHQDLQRQQQQQLEDQERQRLMQNAMRKSKGLFSGLSRRFGLDSNESSSSGAHDAAAAEAERNRHRQLEANNHSGGSQTAHAPPAASAGSEGNVLGDDGRVTSPAAVQQNMLNAIHATRPYGSSSLFQPPKTNLVKEQASYCDRNHAQDLAMVAQAPRGMNVFLAREISEATATAAADFLSRNGQAIAAFEALLLDVAAVYDLAPGVMHLYYDAVGPTIAFNTNGSIFCNLRYFMQLHAGASSAQSKVDATVWWWVVVAHELAHNLESSHNSNHSYYTESFVQQYFHKMTTRAVAWMSGGGRSTDGADNAGHDASLAAPPSYQQATADLQQHLQQGRRATNLMD